MSKKVFVIWVVLAIAVSSLAYLLLAEMPSCFTAKGAVGFAASLYAAGVDEAAMRRVWHAGWMFSILAPWMALAGFFIVRWLFCHAWQLNRLAVFLPVLAILSLLSLPDPVLTMLPGVDNSWQWMLGHFAFSNVFGSETVFTYGPLGFLICPQGSMSVCLVALVANLIFAALWAFELVIVFKSGREGRLVAWLLLLTMFFPQGSMEWRWVLLAVMSLSIPVFGGESISMRLSSAMVVIGGVMLAVTSLTKFSSLIVVAGSQLMLLAYMVFLTRRYRLMFCYGIGFVLPFVIFSCWGFTSFEAFVLWFKGSILIASGYNRHMVMPHEWYWIAFPIVVGLTMVFVYSRQVCHWWNTFGMLLLFSPLLFCTAKYSWVRQGPGPFLYAVAVIVAFMVWSRPTTFRRMLFISLGALLFSYGLVLPRFFAGNSYFPAPFGVNPMGIVRTCNLKNEIGKSNERSKLALKDHQAPETWWNSIGNDSVMMFPDEYAPVMGRDGVNLVLLPSFQLYSGCLPQLDRMNAALIEGDNAPRHIICRIDAGPRSGRMVNYPQAWSAILSNYDCRDVANGYAWLKHRKENRKAQFELRNSVDCKVGEWVELPREGGSALAVDWHQTTAGKVASLFLRNTQTYISFRFDDGTETRDQLMVENIAYPFEMACIPKDDAGMVEILRGNCSRKVRAIRLDADAKACYASEFKLNYFSEGQTR